MSNLPAVSLVMITLALPSFGSAQPAPDTGLRGVASSTVAPRMVMGRVTDPKHGRPLVNVSVFLEREGDTVQALSNAEGRFSLTAPSPGRFLLRILTIGYQQLADSVEIEADRGTVVHAAMATSRVSLCAQPVCSNHSGRCPPTIPVDAEVRSFLSAMAPEVPVTLVVSTPSSVDSVVAAPQPNLRSVLASAGSEIGNPPWTTLDVRVSAPGYLTWETSLVRDECGRIQHSPLRVWLLPIDNPRDAG